MSLHDDPRSFVRSLLSRSTRVVRDERARGGVGALVVVLAVTAVTAAAVRPRGPGEVPAALTQTPPTTAAVEVPGKAVAPAAPVFRGEGSREGFPEGTAVATPGGPVPVERIVAGDSILTFDDGENALAVRRVTRTRVVERAALVELTMSAPDGEADTLRVTPEHRFWTLGKSWVAARALAAGDTLVNAAGDPVVVKTVEVAPGAYRGYDLELEGGHAYFVGEPFVLARNED